MILDATAGNRTMYETKDVNKIIYIDIEKQLWRKPTIFADCTRTPFKPKTFHTIFFDPPRTYRANHPTYLNVSKRIRKAIHRYKPFADVYYGWDKYKNRQELIAFIYRAQKEFLRILRDDGLLRLKWCEVDIPLHNILAIFQNWRILLKLNIEDPTHTFGKGQTYWICMCKKEGYQTELSAFQS